jgi:glycosyltransferase involved in cell wall biosynthesis
VKGESLNVLLVGDYPDDARLGSSKVVHKLQEALRAAGHTCDALFTADLGPDPANRQVRQAVAPILAARAIAKAFRNRTYDVVDAASAEGLWFGVGRTFGRNRRIAFVCRSHGLEHLNYQRMLEDSRTGLSSKPWTRRLWYPMSRLSQVAAAAKLADRLLLLNDTDRRFAIDRRWQPAARIDVVPHGVSDGYLTSGVWRGARGRGALFCGSWDRAKGITYLVTAFERLARSGTPVPLTVLGPGLPRTQVLAEFSETVRPYVTIVDRAAEERVMDELRQHDVLVSPSTYEGFGLIVIEAMSQGLPVIATPVGCAASLVRDGETGARVPARDADALAAAVHRLMRSPEDRTRLATNAAALVAGMSWRETARQTVDVYQKALAHVRQAPLS